MNLFDNLSSKVPFWNVDLPKSPWDMDEDNEENLDVLCELVRNQYLKHLRQTLLDNLDVSKSLQKKHLYHIEECVDVCIAEMEKQALRRCMMASIYRECMSNMINQVKTCTKNSVLYVLLKHLIESNNQLSYTYLKTDNKTKNMNSIGINTEFKSNKVATTQTEICTLSDNIISTTLLDNNINKDHINKSSLLPSSYNVKSMISESNIFDDLNSLLKSPSYSISSSSDTPMEVNGKCDSSEFSILQKNLENENYKYNDILSINALLRDLQDSPEYEQSLPCSKLDERLKALGLEIENYKCTDNVAKSTTSNKLAITNCLSPNIIRQEKIKEVLINKFKSDRIAKTYELRRSMNELPQEQRTRLNQRFNELFGDDHNYETDPLSEEEEHIIAHKRVVKMVVELMTPYYKAQRINRHLFKTLAKLISKNLMNEAYDPDQERVAKGVNEFFIGDRCIKTIEDIYQ